MTTLNQIAAQAAGQTSGVLDALRQASRETGSDFNYLLGVAMRESGLQTDAKSKTSSATGLFQFIDQTWLGLVKKFGDEYGLGGYADAITKTDSGKYVVADADTRKAILALRKDPKISALMAGHSAVETQNSLKCSLGRDVGCGELYAAHFLGPAGAKQLIRAHDTDPSTAACDLFPDAASANKSVFYHSDGTPKSVGEVYKWAVKLPKSDTVLATATPAVDENILEIRCAAPQTQTAAVDPAIWGGFGTMKRWFSSAADMASDVLPSAPLMLTPGILDVLSAAGAPAESEKSNS